MQELNLIHNIFYDTSVFRPITKKGSEKLYDCFYDSLIKHMPLLHNGFYKHISPGLLC